MTALVTAAVTAGLTLAVWLSPAVREGVRWFTPHSQFAFQAAALICIAGSALADRKRWGLDRLASDLARKGRWVRPALPSLCIVAFLLPVFYSWVALPEHYYSIAGMLPGSDAGDYYAGALSQLVTGRLDEWNSRRPINACLLAVRLACCGGDFRAALILQAALLGLATWLLAAAVGREKGFGAGLLTFSILFYAGRKFAATTLSEALGLTLGALAGLLLWQGTRRRSRLECVLGLFMMTTALNARAGAFLVLPLLAAWCAWAFRGEGKRVNWRIGAVAVSAVALAFAFNSSLRGLYGTGFGLGHGNFSMTLYGLSTGEPGWTRIIKDYPDAARLSEPELNRFAYARAWGNICDDPPRLMKGLWIGGKFWLRGFYTMLAEMLGLGIASGTNPALTWLAAGAVVLGVFAFLWARAPAGVVAALVGMTLLAGDLGLGTALNRVVLWGLASGAVWRLWTTRRDAECWLFLAHTAGFLCSGVIVFPDAGHRALIVSYPLLFVPFALGAGGPRDPPRQPAAAAARASAAIVLSVVLLVAAAVGPALCHALWPMRLTDPPAQFGDADILLVRAGPGAAHVNLLAPGVAKPTFAPDVRDEDFARYNAGNTAEYWGARQSNRLRGPLVIAQWFNLDRRRPGVVWVIGPPEIMGPRTQRLVLKGKTVTQGGVRYFLVSGYEAWEGS